MNEMQNVFVEHVILQNVVHQVAINVILKMVLKLITVRHVNNERNKDKNIRVDARLLIEIHFCVAVMCLSFVCDYDYIMPAYCLADACLYEENIHRFFLIVLQQSSM